MGQEAVNKCWEYNSQTNKLEDRQDMCEPRSEHAVVYVAHLDRIYVLGGNDRRNFLSKCEYYEPSEDMWTPIASMDVPRDQFAACLFDERYIYTFSGRIKFNPKEVANVIEMYDIDFDKWQNIRMKQKCPFVKSHSSMAWQLGESQSICIFGGMAGNRRTEKCFLFNTETHRFETSESMPEVGSFSDAP